MKVKKKVAKKLTLDPKKVSLFKDQILLVLDDYRDMSSDFLAIKVQQEGTRIEIANRIIANFELIMQQRS